ncbi:MAG: class I SAM-dependent methyltransferase [Candidatus Aenigmatarchaeota archaeon]|nr:class I SAM-dependent methyltransferase [Nanoarchaeota archaeon]
MTKPPEHPTWEELYKNENIESMPWFTKELDPDLEEALKRIGIKSGRFLDLGTGPGTQAIQLAERGFDVTGTDISDSAIQKATKLSGKVNFVVDNILETRLERNGFDFIFDRGMFHVLDVEDRKTYMKNIKKILNDNGMLFLKCFSVKQEDNLGPHRFSKEDIEREFGSDFVVESVKDTVYQGYIKPSPNALFCVMRKKS